MDGTGTGILAYFGDLADLRMEHTKRPKAGWDERYLLKNPR